MRDITKELFNKSISILNRMGIENKDIIVTGSVALDILGVLPDEHDIHDFDCIINVDKEKLGVVKLICEIFKSDKTPSCISENSRMVDINGILLNIWFNLPNIDASVTYNGVFVKDILSILAEKKKYNREKDVRDINQIVKKILN